MRRNVIIAGLILCAVACYAGPDKISNPQATQEREVAAVVATNVSLDALAIEIGAANNTAKLQTAMLKLVGRMQAEERAKKAAKDKAKQKEKAK
jgi:hypothetical protein